MKAAGARISERILPCPTRLPYSLYEPEGTMLGRHIMPGMSGRETLLAQSRAFFIGIGAVPDVIELVGERLNAVIDCIEAGSTVNEWWTEATALLEMQRYAISVPEYVAHRSLLGVEQMS